MVLKLFNVCASLRLFPSQPLLSDVAHTLCAWFVFQLESPCSRTQTKWQEGSEVSLWPCLCRVEPSLGWVLIPAWNLGKDFVFSGTTDKPAKLRLPMLRARAAGVVHFCLLHSSICWVDTSICFTGPDSSRNTERWNSVPNLVKPLKGRGGDHPTCPQLLCVTSWQCSPVEISFFQPIPAQTSILGWDQSLLKCLCFLLGDGECLHNELKTSTPRSELELGDSNLTWIWYQLLKLKSKGKNLVKKNKTHTTNTSDSKPPFTLSYGSEFISQSSWNSPRFPGEHSSAPLPLRRILP